MAMEPAAHKFARMARRLASRPDRSDVGQLLPNTAAALEQEDPADQLAHLVRALGEERVVIPVPVEAHPSLAGEHKPQDLHEESKIPLATQGAGEEREVVAFTSAAQLQAWDRTARPMTMTSQKMAITAIASGVPRVRIDPAGASVLIPRPAVEALAALAPWNPPWQGSELAEVLSASAMRTAADWATFVDVKVSHGPDALVVEVQAAPRIGAENVQAKFASLLALLGQHPRLAGAAEKIEFVPKIVPET